MKYKKKPVVIEAVQYNGLNTDEIKKFVGDNLEIDCVRDGSDGTPVWFDLKIKTLEGIMTASKGDFIIKGVNGEFYPCKPDIFEKTYEKVY